MPYRSINDPKLPGRVRRASPAQRRRFVAAFNAAIRERPGEEGRAFRIAYAAMGPTRATDQLRLRAHYGLAPLPAEE